VCDPFVHRFPCKFTLQNYALLPRTMASEVVELIQKASTKPPQFSLSNSNKQYIFSLWHVSPI